MKIYNGSSWVDAKAMIYNGSSWVNATVKVAKSDGAWDTVSAKNNVVNVSSSWSQIYKKDSEKRTGLNTLIQQGKYKDDDTNGICRSLIGFSLSPYTGKNIKSVRLKLRSSDFYYTSGATIHIGWHKHSSKPAKFSHTKYSVLTHKFTAKEQEQWITMPQEVIDEIKSGNLKGFSIFYNIGLVNAYGRLYGHGSSYPPVLEVTYI